MSTPIVRILNIGKQYRLGLTFDHNTLRDHVAYSFQSLLKAAGRTHRWSAQEPAQDASSRHFWALKHVTVDIQQGEVIGIIGRNGAGKSTLLKLLSQITEPSEGEIRIRGRVAALLEVGTGFHQELSGRENIFMNGAILGMTKAEIKRKFDEIIAFAGIESFIDTPVKRYSSGMLVRLGFSVAAHLEPEILVVDEVLAVGDAEFQKKCLGKMDTVSKSGRTVFFISHNMSAISNLCTRVLTFDHGRLIDDGLPDKVINTYMASFVGNIGGEYISEQTDRSGDGKIRIKSVQFGDRNGEWRGYWKTGDLARLRIHYTNLTGVELSGVDVAVGIRTMVDNPCLYLSTKLLGESLIVKPGEGWFVCEIRDNPLEAGMFKLNIEIKHKGAKSDHIQGVGHFEVLDSNYYGTGETSRYGGVVCRHSWSSE
jgi:lipopolysaccharide transport system ATP-binding protein